MTRMHNRPVRDSETVKVHEVTASDGSVANQETLHVADARLSVLAHARGRQHGRDQGAELRCFAAVSLTDFLQTITEAGPVLNIVAGLPDHRRYLRLEVSPVVRGPDDFEHLTPAVDLVARRPECYGWTTHYRCKYRIVIAAGQEELSVSTTIIRGSQRWR